MASGRHEAETIYYEPGFVPIKEIRYVILRTNRAIICIFNKEIRKAFLERAVVELVYNFNEKSLRVLENR